MKDITPYIMNNKRIIILILTAILISAISLNFIISSTIHTHSKNQDLRQAQLQRAEEIQVVNVPEPLPPKKVIGNRVII